MGSLTSNIPQLIGFVSQGANLVRNVVDSEVGASRQQESQELALRQLQQKQAVNQQQAERNAELERKQIAEQSAINEENRRAALKRAVARQRSQFGGRGISSSGGSSEAVLLGMFGETEDELAQRERLDNLRFGALDSDLAQSRSLNILQYEQLRERQKLSEATRSYDRISSGLDFGLGATKLGLDIYRASR